MCGYGSFNILCGNWMRWLTLKSIYAGLMRWMVVEESGRDLVQ